MTLDKSFHFSVPIYSSVKMERIIVYRFGGVVRIENNIYKVHVIWQLVKQRVADAITVVVVIIIVRGSNSIALSDSIV